jgi:hypothetical protein
MVRTKGSPTFQKGIIGIVGGYGSGKSEVAVNLSRHLAATGDKPVAIADLDIVNPYFRSREAAKQLESLGIRPLVPPGEQAQADLPIIIPEIKGAIKRHDGTLILDVGGDDAGSRVLSSLADAFVPGEYEFLLVLNANRPFTSTLESSIETMRRIETSSRLSFTGLIANTHLMEETTAEVVLDGLRLAEAVSAATSLPIAFVSATGPVLEKLTSRLGDYPVLRLDRSLVKPWEKRF